MGKPRNEIGVTRVSGFRVPRHDSESGHRGIQPHCYSGALPSLRNAGNLAAPYTSTFAGLPMCDERDKRADDGR